MARHHSILASQDEQTFLSAICPLIAGRFADRSLEATLRVFVALQTSVPEGGAQRTDGAVVVRVAWLLDATQIVVCKRGTTSLS